MRRSLTAVLAFLLVISGCSPALSGRQPSGEILAFGVMSVKGRTVEKSPDTIQGIQARSTLGIAEKTDQITATRGLSFGISYVVTGVTKNADYVLDKVVIHPKMRTPDGKEITSQEFKIRGKSSDEGTIVRTTGYEFTDEFEMVRGKWKIQLWYNDKMLVEQSFDVK